MKQSTETIIAELITGAAETEAARFEEEFYFLAEQCESPIEKLLLAALFADHRINPWTEIVFMGRSKPSKRYTRSEAIFIYQQAPVGKYRVDFLILDCSVPLELKEPRWMVVECDGHDYHERTKEQAKRDKQRDRYFQSRNYKVLRFTGSEIWNDHEACADEIISQLARDDGSRNEEE